MEDRRKKMLSNIWSVSFKNLEKSRSWVCRGEESTKASRAPKEAVGVGLHRETGAIWWRMLKATKNNENQCKSAREMRSQKWGLEDTLYFYIWWSWDSTNLSDLPKLKGWNNVIIKWVTLRYGFNPVWTEKWKSWFWRASVIREFVLHSETFNSGPSLC